MTCDCFCILPSSPWMNTNDPCGISGKWKNQLGSIMEISCQDGSLSGKYSSAVGVAVGFYKLLGQYNIVGANNNDCVVGFSVAWNNDVMGNSNSTTSWTGIHYASEGMIHTHWILVRYMEPNKLWTATMVGHDVLKRI
ncbi:hypothetical protein ACJMK2_014709 [Sinanodonta woodiana]|uniref:Uncharacterized protein n=1 Tax=Sinanodonta woodiana TaxID=1069815 RepID=A0ABD3V4Q8_SINWO